MAVTFAMDAFLQKTETLAKDLYKLKLGHFLSFFFLFLAETRISTKMRQANVYMSLITKCEKQQQSTEMFF